MRGIISIFLFFIISTAVLAHKTDSIGTKTQNGFVFIQHEVVKGDGLYSISRKYKVSLQEIVAKNPGADEVIKLGQILLIPTGNKSESTDLAVNDFFTSKGDVKDMPAEVVREDKEVSTFAKYHKVMPGETLYAISKRYNTSVEMIKTLNALENNELSEGQRLLVQDGSAKTTVETRENEVEMDYTKMKDAMDDEDYSNVGFESDVETQSTQNAAGFSQKVQKLVEYNIEKIEETGIVRVGGSKIPTDKNFAAHFSAPIGTVIMVTNPETKKTVFVKVVSNFVRKDGESTIIVLSESSAKEIDVENESAIQLSYAR